MEEEEVAAEEKRRGGGGRQRSEVQVPGFPPASGSAVSWHSALCPAPGVTGSTGNRQRPWKPLQQAAALFTHDFP